MDQTTTTPRHEGVAIQLAGQEWIVPPLSFGQLKRLLPRFQTMQTGVLTPEWIETSVEIVLAALSRNYPDLQAEAVEEMIDMNNYAAILNTILQASGLSQKGEPAGQTS